MLNSLSQRTHILGVTLGCVLLTVRPNCTRIALRIHVWLCSLILFKYSGYLVCCINLVLSEVGYDIIMTKGKAASTKSTRHMRTCPWVMQRFCSQPSMATQSSSSMGASSSASAQPNAASPPQDPSTPGGGGAQGAAQDLRAFCREALYECITQEKPGSLQSYLLLYSLMQGILGNGNPPGIVCSHHPSAGACSCTMHQVSWTMLPGMLQNVDQDKQSMIQHCWNPQISSEKPSTNIRVNSNARELAGLRQVNLDQLPTVYAFSPWSARDHQICFNKEWSSSSCCVSIYQACVTHILTLACCMLSYHTLTCICSFCLHQQILGFAADRHKVKGLVGGLPPATALWNLKLALAYYSTSQARLLSEMSTSVASGILHLYFQGNIYLHIRFKQLTMVDQNALDPNCCQPVTAVGL